MSKQRKRPLVKTKETNRKKSKSGSGSKRKNTIDSRVAIEHSGFLIEFANGSAIKNLFGRLKPLYEEMVLVCTDSGIRSNQMDASCISMVEVFIDPRRDTDAVTFYQCDRPISLGLSLTSINEFFKACSPNKRVRMYITEESATPSLLTFEFGDDDQYSTWQVKLLDISHDPDLSIPECDYKVHVEMDADIFDKAVSMCQKVSSESGTINLSTISNAEEPEFRIDAVSDDLKSGGFVFKDTQNRKSDTDDEMVVVKIKSNIELGFAGTYMSVFSKMQVLSERVNLYIGDDVPAKLVYDLNGMGSVTFHIAPKISEEI